MENYYDLLGLKENATKDEVKKAYKELVKQYHPDVNKSSNAATMFRLINDAYRHLMHDDVKTNKNVNSNYSNETYREKTYKTDTYTAKSHRESETTYKASTSSSQNTNEISKTSRNLKKLSRGLKYLGLKALAAIALLLVSCIFLIVISATFLGTNIGMLILGIFGLGAVVVFFMALSDPQGWLILLFIVLGCAALLLIWFIAVAINSIILITMEKLWDYITY